jgi:outer membrane protein OmpA-like peptidoglycan-associated protein
LVVLLAPTSFALSARAGEPVVGVDLGAAVPVSRFRSTAEPGGSIAPFAGYRLGNTFTFTPILQPQFAAFQTDVSTDRDSDVTSVFSITAGGRFSLIDENREVYFSTQGGYYTDVTGPLNDDGEGFNIAGGFNYEFQPGTALGIFIRRDQSGMQAARGSGDDLVFLNIGLSLKHHFLPPPPPPPAPAVAEAPPPAPVPVEKKKIVLRGVNFDFDKSDIRPDARPILDEAAETLKEYSAVAISVEGHTDAVGTDQYNQGLSVRRAEAVRNYLVERGIDRARMSVEGLGESRPVATNDTDDGRAQNRRVELRIQG